MSKPHCHGPLLCDFRLNFVRPTELKEEFKAALVKGLPYPILTVAEYMSVDAEGFCWGRNYR